MKISINKLKRAVDELQDAELSYKRQMVAFEKVFHEYQSLDPEGKDKRTMKFILEDLGKEYQQIKKIKLTLMQIIRSYEVAEKNIIDSASLGLVSRKIKEIDIGDVQRILKNFKITLR
ncbi:MAG: hypothetical protein K2L07_10960 [Lachnospiraceae bacterium]|nr:hypothetical protein [Lachnospiraceae bacterium]